MPLMTIVKITCVSISGHFSQTGKQIMTVDSAKYDTSRKEERTILIVCASFEDNIVFQTFRINKCA
jgi:hypothetical protein